MSEDAYQKLLQRAFDALSRRPLSEAELRSRLLRRTDDETLIEKVLARVRELGYQDDAQVAESEVRRRGVGVHRVRQRLRQRGISSELLEEALLERDAEAEAEDAREQFLRRLSGWQRKNNPRAAAYGWLARRGYASDVISSLISEFEDELPLPKPKPRKGWGR